MCIVRLAFRFVARKQKFQLYKKIQQSRAEMTIVAFLKFFSSPSCIRILQLLTECYALVWTKLNISWVLFSGATMFYGILNTASTFWGQALWWNTVEVASEYLWQLRTKLKYNMCITVFMMKFVKFVMGDCLSSVCCTKCIIIPLICLEQFGTGV